MSNFRFFIRIISAGLITGIIVGVSLVFHHRYEMAHEYAITSSSGHVYYIDDYSIEDGSIIFTIDGVEYHFSNYSIRDIEK